MTRRLLAYSSIVGLLVLGGVLSIVSYNDTVYALDRANALLNRSETTGFAEELIQYTKRARILLPTKGNPVWIFPTDRTDFEEIQADIESILGRAAILRGLPKESDAYQQGMDDLRGKVRTLQAQISEAAPFLFVSPLNLGLSFVWMFCLLLVTFLSLKRLREEEEERKLEPPVEA